jgi:hypothetical protein
LPELRREATGWLDYIEQWLIDSGTPSGDGTTIVAMTTSNETAISDSLSAAPDVPWAAAAFDLVLSEENRPVANHSVRS